MSGATFLSFPCPKCGARMRYAASTPDQLAPGSRRHHYVCTSPDCSARFTLDRDNQLTETPDADRPQLRFVRQGDLIRLMTNGLTLALVPRSFGPETIVTLEALPGIEAANPHVEFVQIED